MEGTTMADVSMEGSGYLSYGQLADFCAEKYDKYSISRHIAGVLWEAMARADRIDMINHERLIDLDSLEGVVLEDDGSPAKPLDETYVDTLKEYIEERRAFLG